MNGSKVHPGECLGVILATHYCAPRESSLMVRSWLTGCSAIDDCGDQVFSSAQIRMAPTNGPLSTSGSVGKHPPSLDRSYCPPPAFSLSLSLSLNLTTCRPRLALVLFLSFSAERTHLGHRARRGAVFLPISSALPGCCVYLGRSSVEMCQPAFFLFSLSPSLSSLCPLIAAQCSNR